ncbi:hypothetical protein [Candidatus Ishikawella capsulata]|nr:hypothetical protein [Candidatus Ishikawaella capsulata]
MILLMDMLDIHKKRSIRTLRPAKYYYTNENVEKYWTGQGTSIVIQRTVEYRKKLSDFLDNKYR